jgi:predicted nucleic acid-binding OB-fold protein
MTNSFKCTICGHVTDDIKKKHDCATINALIYNADNEPEPRSNVDKLMRKIVKSIQDHLVEFANTPDDESDQIHPRMLCAMTSTNVILNIFNEMVDQKLSPHTRRAMLAELLETISGMTMQGLDAVIKASIVYKNKH